MTTVEAACASRPDLAPASNAHNLSRHSNYYFGENITFKVRMIPDQFYSQCTILI
jgi:hypothetical protein